MTASPTRVDWPRILEEIRQRGYSLYDVAGLTGIPKSSLVGYKNAVNEPRHSVGDLLLQFWCESTGSSVGTEPRVPSFPTAHSLHR